MSISHPACTTLISDRKYPSKNKFRSESILEFNHHSSHSGFKRDPNSLWVHKPNRTPLNNYCMRNKSMLCQTRSKLDFLNQHPTTKACFCLSKDREPAELIITKAKRMLLQQYHNRTAGRRVNEQKCWYYSCHTSYTLTDQFVKLLQHVNKDCLENCTSIRRARISQLKAGKNDARNNMKYLTKWGPNIYLACTLNAWHSLVC